MSQNRTELPVVLVVDDDDTIRMVAEEYLSHEGFSVSVAKNGLEALEMLDSVEPDIILLDVEMPELNGFETCKRVKDLPRYSNTPILMLTGHDDSHSIDRAFTAGATEFAIKPINWILLRHRLRYMLRASETINQLGKSQHSLVAAQRIAQMGNWSLDTISGKMEFSENLYSLLDIKIDQSPLTLDTLIQSIHEDDRSDVRSWIVNTGNVDVAQASEHRIVRSDGLVLDVTQQLEAELDANGKIIHLYGIVQDVTERRKAEAEIYRLAYYDSLTTLPNRALFKTHLDSALSHAKNSGRLVAVLFIDLDDFKKVNDTFGHAVGDLLLQEVGRRLVLSIRGSDVQLDKNECQQKEAIARMGGDEYTILLSSINDAEDAAKVARRIIANLSECYQLAGDNVFITPSVGMAVHPVSGENADELLKNADMAMYCAKRAGKNLYVTHDEAMNESVLKQYQLESQLRGALERDEFALHYQPQLDLASGKMDGIEVLLRWNNEKLGSVSPVDFIPIAEESGLIVTIGEWVMRTACITAKTWLDQGLAFSRIAVNISVLQFLRPDFPKLVSSILEETGLNPNTLELEITESLLAMDTANAVQTLQNLKAIGVELSIDDFGTGYSSLSQLKHFPIDRLKIDRSFIQGITSNSDDAAIANAIIAMGGSMKLKVLAEGVETGDQLDYLKENYCDEVQGYFYSRPLPVEEMEAFLLEQSAGGDQLARRKSA